MREIRVELGERSYPIYVGAGLLSSPDLLTRLLDPASRIMVVTNNVVERLYLDRVIAGLRGSEVRHVVIPDGEQYKNLEVFNGIISTLLEKGFGRDSVLVALGGGVVGDVTGFVAACFQRGTRYLQIPTTLLAQVDSSVGGKTAVNHALGKNMIGAFHQPLAVIADTDVLATLPRRELGAGLAEVIKYGLIQDAEFLGWLEQNIDALLGLEHDALAVAIERSCRIKAGVVSVDEHEAGLRAILNFGHTFGHAIETGLEYRGWLHGEAVAAGMLMAAHLSARMGWLDTETVNRIARLLDRAGLPTRAPAGLSAGRLRELMQADKKSRSGRLRLVLLKGIGNSLLCDDFPEDELMATLRTYAGE